MKNKIDDSILKTYTFANEKTIECIAFLRDYHNLGSSHKNIEIIKEYPFIKAVAIKVLRGDLVKLSSDENVVYISGQKTVKTQIYNSKNFLNIDKFYTEHIFGKNVNVAVIDTGIEPVLDFTLPTNRIVKFVDFVNGKTMPYDDNGHGTFVSGVLLGNGFVSGGKFAGIAPKANIISIKALDENGEASSIKVLDAMQWIFENHDKYNIRIVCMSFGSEPITRNDPLSIGVEVLWKSGVVVVVAGGNSGPDKCTIKSPGINHKVITVGGAMLVDDSFVVPDFSSRGPAQNFFKPDIVAPACDIISNNRQIIQGKAYTKMSGTSVATPIIAGVCALLCEKYPFISPEQVKSYILKHGKSMGYGRNVEGFGLFLS